MLCLKYYQRVPEYVSDNFFGFFIDFLCPYIKGVDLAVDKM